MKRINKNQTFENFSVNDGNAWALAALKKVIEDKNYFNPVYIYGEEGVGKSHLLNATINTIVELNKVAFISAKELSDEIIENVMLSDDNYVLIDDLQLLPKDKALEEKIAMANQVRPDGICHCGYSSATRHSQSSLLMPKKLLLAAWLRVSDRTSLRRAEISAALSISMNSSRVRGNAMFSSP